MSAIWAFLGGIAGIARMIAAGAIVAVCLFMYFYWSIIPGAETKAREGYVLLTRAVTAESTAKTLRDQIGAQKVVIEAYQTQYKNALATMAQEDIEDEARISEYETKLKAAGKSDGLSAADLDFLLRKRQPNTAK